MVKKEKGKTTTLEPFMEKTKLTLSVDREVVEKAKKIGINISKITEEVLKGFSFEVNSSLETNALLEKYKELFKVMLPLLKKFNTEVKIGSWIEYTPEPNYIEDIYLTSDGKIGPPDSSDVSIDKLNAEHVKDFDEPKKILMNFIDVLVRTNEKQKENLRELEISKRIIEVFTTKLSSQKEKKSSNVEHKKKV